MKKIFISVLLGLLLFQNTGCSGNTCGGDKLNLIISVRDFSCWLNLMPGGPGSFHFSGNILISNEEEFTLNNLVFTNAVVVQEGNEIYSVDVASQPEYSTVNAGEQIVVSIFTNDNHPIISELDQDRPVDFILSLKTEKGKKSVRILNVQIERAY